MRINQLNNSNKISFQFHLKGLVNYNGNKYCQSVIMRFFLFNNFLIKPKNHFKTLQMFSLTYGITIKKVFLNILSSLQESH